MEEKSDKIRKMSKKLLKFEAIMRQVLKFLKMSGKVV